MAYSSELVLPRWFHLLEGKRHSSSLMHTQSVSRWLVGLRDNGATRWGKYHTACGWCARTRLYILLTANGLANEDTKS